MLTLCRRYAELVQDAFRPIFRPAFRPRDHSMTLAAHRASSPLVSAPERREAAQRLLGGRPGFALVAALWLLVAVAGVAAALQAVAVAERRGAANYQGAVEARWAARGAIAYELARVDHALARHGRGGGAVDTIIETVSYTLAGRRATVRVEDPRTRVNVNLAGGPQLAALFRAAGLDRRSAARLAAEIVAWRDTVPAAAAPVVDASNPDRLAPPGAVFPPLGHAFGEVDELATVPGMTPPVYRRVAPYLTVHGDGRVNVNRAPRPVLLSLPGVDSAAAAVITGRRATAPFNSTFEVVASLGTVSHQQVQQRFGEFVDLAAFAPRDIVLTATIDGMPAGVTAVVRLAGGAAWSVVGTIAR